MINNSYLIGQKFNRLTVMSTRYDKNKKRTYLSCICDCGNKLEVEKNNLLAGRSKSCGCLQKEKSNDIVGKRFGRLLVKKRLPYLYNNNESIYVCECDCGNTVECPRHILISGKVKSCGCKLREIAQKNVKKNVGIREGTNISLISSKKINKNNTSGYKGVTYDKSTEKWVAQITFKSKHYHLGKFKNIEDAIKARKQGEEKYFKSFLDSR